MSCRCGPTEHCPHCPTRLGPLDRFALTVGALILAAVAATAESVQLTRQFLRRHR